jgi:hypothetical protein
MYEAASAGAGVAVRVVLVWVSNMLSKSDGWLE